MSRYSRRRQRAKSRSLHELLVENPAAFRRRWRELEDEWIAVAHDSAPLLAGIRTFRVGDHAAAIVSALPVTHETQRARATVGLLESVSLKAFARDLDKALAHLNRRLKKV